MNELDLKVLEFLKVSPDKAFNISEISRAMEKAPPTIKRVVDRLAEEGYIDIVDKKSMKLIILKGAK